MRALTLDQDRHNWKQNLKVDRDTDRERRKQESRARAGGAYNGSNRLNDLRMIWRMTQLT
jgi:hypothetical protein